MLAVPRDALPGARPPLGYHLQQYVEMMKYTPEQQIFQYDSYAKEKF
jgi:hypothetical protein